ncbi:MAG: hypothetical protein ABWY56_07090 [Propionibacteriaceae bacterium]
MAASLTVPGLERVGQHYQLNQFSVERRGRVHSCVRALSVVLFGFVMLLPVWAVCRGWLPIQSDQVPPVVTGRIALLIGALLIPSYVQLGFRCWELVRSARAPRVLERMVTVGLVLTGVAGVLHAVKVVVLWQRLPAHLTYPVSLASGGWGTVGISLLVMGLALCLLAAVSSEARSWFTQPHEDGTSSGRTPLAVAVLGLARGLRLERPVRAGATASELTRWRMTMLPDKGATPDDRPGSVICCSGGGIRSASFCLGGLQELHRQGIYQKAAAVIGVSGGGYIASAMHVLRWQSAAPPQQEAAEQQTATPRGTSALPSAAEFDGPFSTSSPELGWLRRHTDYLFSSSSVRTQALLTILTGLSVNLVLCVFALGVTSWWLGWFFNSSGAIRDWLTLDAIAGDYRGAWRFLDYVWTVAAAGAGLYFVQRATVRLWRLPSRLCAVWQWAAVRLVWLGIGAHLALVIMPAGLVLLHNYAAGHDTPTAALITAIGLMPESVCTLVESYGWCGASTRSFQISVSESSVASLLAVLTAIVAVLRSASGKWPATSAATTRFGALMARLSVTLRHFVVPWLAFLAVMTAGLAVLLRWSVAPLADPGLLARWSLIYTIGGLFLAVMVLTDVNWTSLHHFYRERLSTAFFLRRTATGGLEPVNYDDPLRFSKSGPGPFGGPALVSCAVANVSDPDIVPARRHGTPFVFSHDHIGLTDRMLPDSRRSLDSATYEYAADYKYRDVTIAAATAMSGAAFSPLAGRMQGRIAPYRFVMALANARLGVWLPNPMWIDTTRSVRSLIRARGKDGDVLKPWTALPEEEKDYLVDRVLAPADLRWLANAISADDNPDSERGRWATRCREAADRDSSWMASVPVVKSARTRDDRRKVRTRGFRVLRFFSYCFGRPTAFRLLKEAAGSTSVYDRKLYITDGGHYDNLGLVEALRRRARVIYVLDASNDEENTFTSLGEAIATARMDLDCVVAVDWKPMCKPAEGRAAAAFASGTVTYSDGASGVLHVVKALLPTDLTLDSEVYAARHRDYPRTSTGEQRYGEFDLEAYRALGEQATRSMLTSHAKLSVAGNGHRPGQQPSTAASLTAGRR